MAQRRLTSTGRWLLGLLALLTFLTYLHLSSISSTSGRSALDVDSIAPASTDGSSNPATLLRVAKRSDIDYYEEQGGAPSSSNYESSLERGSGTSSNAGDDRALQDDDGEEGKDVGERDRIWTTCKTRGANLVKLFGKTMIPDSEKSTFKKYDDLVNHEWTVKEDIVDPTAQDLTLKNPLDKMQIPYGKQTVDTKQWHSLEYSTLR